MMTREEYREKFKNKSLALAKYNPAWSISDTREVAKEAADLMHLADDYWGEIVGSLEHRLSEYHKMQEVTSKLSTIESIARILEIRTRPEDEVEK